MTPIERSPERDAALDALLPLVPSRGWTIAALTEAAGPDADLLFPGGVPELVEAWCDLTDRRMEADVAGLDLAAMRLPARLRAVLAARFARNRPHKEAVPRALGVMALPGRAGLAARCSARTVDAMWHAAGDRSADFSWYTKRAILTGIYATTLLYWLRDDSDNDWATLDFLDRRLAGVARFGRVRAKVDRVLRRA
jgi:ubiquinone biosynthesis protein COQ9